MTSVRTRWGAGIAALALTGAGLTACQTNVGAAATVGGSRISEGDVSNYLTSAASAGGQSLVVDFLVEEKLYERALADKGQLPSATQLDLDAAGGLSLLFQQEVPSAQAKASLLDPTLTKAGVKSDYDATILRAAELKYAFVAANKITTLAQLVKAVSHVPVSVSPRYGKWDGSTLQLGAAPTPDFLTTSTSAAATPAG